MNVLYIYDCARYLRCADYVQLRLGGSGEFGKFSLAQL